MFEKQALITQHSYTALSVRINTILKSYYITTMSNQGRVMKYFRYLNKHALNNNGIKFKNNVYTEIVTRNQNASKWKLLRLLCLPYNYLNPQSRTLNSK